MASGVSKVAQLENIIFPSHDRSDLKIGAVMASGIEIAGLALALLPLFVNQIDVYVRGIEKIKLLRRYKREFKGYSVGLRTQSIFLLNTLEKALEGVVHDEDRVSQLICNPESDGWMDADLQQRMRQKLGRNYEVFVDNMTGLSELLHQLKRKLGIDEANERVSSCEDPMQSRRPFV